MRFTLRHVKKKISKECSEFILKYDNKHKNDNKKSLAVGSLNVNLEYTHIIDFIKLEMQQRYREINNNFQPRKVWIWITFVEELNRVVFSYKNQALNIPLYMKRDMIQIA